jgi:hypothetical protein
MEQRMPRWDLLGLASMMAFGAAYVLLVGALTYVNAVLFGLVEREFLDARVQGWLHRHWPLQTIFYAPAAVAALLATWYSARSSRDAIFLLIFFLGVILLMMEWDYGSWELLKPSTLIIALLLAIGFFITARICRKRAS